jgi:hypothetical protein
MKVADYKELFTLPSRILIAMRGEAGFIPGYRGHGMPPAAHRSLPPAYPPVMGKGPHHRLPHVSPGVARKNRPRHE